MSIRELAAQDVNYETNSQIQSNLQDHSVLWNIVPVNESHTLSQPGCIEGVGTSGISETEPLSPPLSAEVGELVVEGVQLWLSSQTPSKPSVWEEAMGLSPSTPSQTSSKPSDWEEATGILLSTSREPSDPLMLLQTGFGTGCGATSGRQANRLTERPVQKTGIKKHKKAKRKSQKNSLKYKELEGQVSLEKINAYIRTLEDSCENDHTVHITIKASKFPECNLNAKSDKCTCGLSNWISTTILSKQIFKKRSKDPPKMMFRIWSEFGTFNNFQAALIDGRRKRMRWVTYQNTFQDDRRFQVRQRIARHIIADKTIAKLYGGQEWTHVKNSDWLENPSKPHRQVTTANGWELWWKSFSCEGGFPKHPTMIQNIIHLAYQATVIELTKDIAENWPLLPYSAPSIAVRQQFEKNIINRLGQSEAITLGQIDYKPT